MENKKLWFKAKRYGWGWYPISWEGWVIILMYVAVITKGFVLADINSHSDSDTLIVFAPIFIVATGLLLVICYRKGEYPHWSWGEPRD